MSFDWNQVKEIINIVGSPIFGLMGTIVGGFVTYKTTKSLNNQSFRLEKNYSKLSETYIPLCSSLENAIEAMEKYPLLPENAFGFERLISLLFEPTRFLNAEYRLRINKAIRQKLEKYKTSLMDVEDVIATETSNYQTEIENLLYVEIVRDNMNECISVTYEEKLYSLQRSFITQKFNSILTRVSCVDLIKEFEDGSGDCHSMYPLIAKNDNEDEEIEYQNSLNEVLIAAINKIKDKERHLFLKTIKESKSKEEFTKLTTDLIKLRDDLIKYIDELSCN